MDNSLLFVSLVYVYLNYPRGQNRYVVKKTIIKKKKIIEIDAINLAGATRNCLFSHAHALIMHNYF